MFYFLSLAIICDFLYFDEDRAFSHTLIPFFSPSSLQRL